MTMLGTFIKLKRKLSILSARDKIDLLTQYSTSHPTVLDKLTTVMMQSAIKAKHEEDRNWITHFANTIISYKHKSNDNQSPPHQHQNLQFLPKDLFQYICGLLPNKDIASLQLASRDCRLSLDDYKVRILDVSIALIRRHKVTKLPKFSRLWTASFSINRLSYKHFNIHWFDSLKHLSLHQQVWRETEIDDLHNFKNLRSLTVTGKNACCLMNRVATHQLNALSLDDVDVSKLFNKLNVNHLQNLRSLKMDICNISYNNKDNQHESISQEIIKKMPHLNVLNITFASRYRSGWSTVKNAVKTMIKHTNPRHLHLHGCVEKIKQMLSQYQMLERMSILNVEFSLEMMTLLSNMNIKHIKRQRINVLNMETTAFKLMLAGIVENADQDEDGSVFKNISENPMDVIYKNEPVASALKSLCKRTNAMHKEQSVSLWDEVNLKIADTVYRVHNLYDCNKKSHHSVGNCHQRNYCDHNIRSRTATCTKWFYNHNDRLLCTH
eukprot:107630_1